MLSQTGCPNIYIYIDRYSRSSHTNKLTSRKTELLAFWAEAHALSDVLQACSGLCKSKSFTSVGSSLHGSRHQTRHASQGPGKSFQVSTERSWQKEEQDQLVTPQLHCKALLPENLTSIASHARWRSACRSPWRCGPFERAFQAGVASLAHIAGSVQLLCEHSPLEACKLNLTRSNAQSFV